MPRPIVWHGAAWVHGLLSLEPVFWTYRVAAGAAELKRQSIITTRRRTILAGLSKREQTPQGVSLYRKGFVACLCAFRPQRSHSGHGIPICLDRGASGLALRSDHHQGGGTTEVLVCKFIAKLLLGGLLCEPLGIHGIFGGLGDPLVDWRARRSTPMSGHRWLCWLSRSCGISNSIGGVSAYQVYRFGRFNL